MLSSAWRKFFKILLHVVTSRHSQRMETEVGQLILPFRMKSSSQVTALVNGRMVCIPGKDLEDIIALRDTTYATHWINAGIGSVPNAKYAVLISKDMLLRAIIPPGETLWLHEGGTMTEVEREKFEIATALDVWCESHGLDPLNLQLAIENALDSGNAVTKDSVVCVPILSKTNCLTFVRI